MAGLLLPEAVAYAGLAQLPVVHGLSAALVGLVIYALLGGSRYAIVAPTSSTATLAAAAVTSLSGATVGGDRTAALLGLSLLAGALLLLLAWARQGQLSAYISRPVLRGFAFGLALSIAVRQLPDALGLSLPVDLDRTPLPVLRHLVGHVASVDGLTALLAAASAALFAGLRRWPRLPASLIVLILAITIAWGADLPAHGVTIIGPIGPLQWQASAPVLPLDEWFKLAEVAFGLVLLIFAESWGSMRTLALRHDQGLNPNRELWVLGLCNVATAVLQGMPVGAGFSATNANEAAGARSRWAGAFAGVSVALVIAFALPALAWLPRSVLATTVIAALWHALDPRQLALYWRLHRDRFLLVGAIAAVLAFGVLDGMLAAIGLSLLAALRRFSQPVVHELGELGRSRNYLPINGHPDVVAHPRLAILRPEVPLFFASADRITEEVLARVAKRPDVRTVILSLEESSDLDSTAAECLHELDQRLRRGGTTLVLSRVKDPVRELLLRFDPTGLGSSTRLFWSVADAVRACEATPDRTTASAADQ